MGDSNGTTRGVGWDISFYANIVNPTLEDFILGLFGFYALRVRREKNTTREAHKGTRAVPL